ncbi:MAG TPA: hypothetical protein VHB01_08560 [Nitrosospira sp.]|nr:hypothetical protein [Nitrosospira sp.]
MFLSAGAGEPSIDPPMRGNAKRVSGKWVGSYECFQGKNGATLILTGHKTGYVEGSFSFYPTSSNPKTATGRFVLTGSYYYDGSLILDSGAWVEKPEGYIPISLKGKVNSAFDTFTGTVPECFDTEFSLKKIPGLHYDKTLD